MRFAIVACLAAAIILASMPSVEGKRKRPGRRGGRKRTPAPTPTGCIHEEDNTVPAFSMGSCAQERADIYAHCGNQDATFPELSLACCAAQAVFIRNKCPCSFAVRILMGASATREPNAYLDRLMRGVTNATCAELRPPPSAPLPECRC